MSSDNNRWWENYLVRYLVGNIFAVLVIFYLIGFHGQEIQTKLCGSQKEIDLCKTEKFSSYVYNFIFQTNQELDLPNLAVGSVVIKPQARTNEIGGNIYLTGEKDKNRVIKFDTTTINFVSIFVLGVFGFCYMYISSIPILFLHVIRGYFYYCKIKKFKCLERIYCFLEESTTARNNANPEFISSYKHAREHGNAYGIILMELLFAFCLIWTKFCMWFLVGWLSLGFSTWLIGIGLEFKMVSVNQCKKLIYPRDTFKNRKLKK